MRYQTKWEGFPWILLISFWTTLQTVKDNGKTSRGCSELVLSHGRSHSPCALTLSPLVLNHICLPRLFPFYLVMSLFLFPFALFLCLSTVTSFLYVHFHLLFLINSLTLPGIAKHIFFMIFSHKKECALSIDWKVSLIWIPPTLPEGSMLTIKLELFLLLAVVLINVGRKMYNTHLCKPEIEVKKADTCWDFIYCTYVRKLAWYTWKDCKRVGRKQWKCGGSHLLKFWGGIPSGGIPKLR